MDGDPKASASGLSLFLTGTSDEPEISHLLPAALAGIRKHLGMDVAFLSEFSRGRRVFRAVDAAVDTPIQVGGSDPLEASYCQRVADGRLPELIHDAKAIPEAMALPVTAALPVGAHLSVPVRLADGSVYGTFCCFSSTPDGTLNDRDLAVMRVFADWIGGALDKDRTKTQEQETIRTRIRGVIDGPGLSSVYQPIYDLTNKTISGFEALSRFSVEPKQGPDVWFAQAATVGLGVELELKSIQTAVMALNHFPVETYLSVNVSPTLLTDGRIERLVDALPADRLVLELTEHETIAKYDQVLHALKSFRDRGIRIAVDDAGAGYSSFRHILEIMPAFIKLDVSLTRNIDKDTARRALTAAMVRFCDETRSKLVAEGIETKEELQTLADLGVAAGQGYFLQRPQTLEVAASLLGNKRD